jgi:hypothetical protein
MTKSDLMRKQRAFCEPATDLTIATLRRLAQDEGPVTFARGAPPSQSGKTDGIVSDRPRHRRSAGYTHLV